MCKYIDVKREDEFGDLTIEFVNDGSWELFTGTHLKNQDVKYALKTGYCYFFLDKYGKAILQRKTLKNFKVEDIALFSQ